MSFETPNAKLIRALVLSVYPDFVSGESQEVQTAVSRATKLIHFFGAREKTSFEILVAPEIASHPKSARLKELIRVLPKTEKNLRLLYLLCQTKNSPYKKKRKWETAAKPVADAPKIPSADFDPSFVQALADIKAFTLGNSLSNGSMLAVDNKKRLVLNSEGVLLPSVVREMVVRANLFAFFYQKIADFVAQSSNSPYTNLVKDMVRLCPNADAFAALISNSSVCTLAFMDSTLAQLETHSLLIHQLSFCESEEMILNCLLRNFYNPRNRCMQEVVRQVLTRLSPSFCRQLVDFITRDSRLNYFRPLGRSPKHIFTDIEVFEKNLPYRVVSPEFLKKMLKVRTLVNLLQTEFLADSTWTLKDLAPEKISLCDENSILVFQNEVEKVYTRLQEKLSDFLTQDGVLLREMEVYRLTVLGGFCPLIEELIREYQKLSRYHHSRMHLESAFENAYRRLPPSYQPYYQYFTVIFYEPLGDLEAVSTNLFVRFDYSAIPRVIANAHFQENNMKVFNFFLKFREFSAEWQDYAWENRRVYNRSLHQLEYAVRLFLRNFLAYFSHQVVDVLCRDLQAKLRKATKADDILGHINLFSDQLVDFLFLNPGVAPQRTIFLLLDMLVSRLRNFMAIPKPSPPQCVSELRAYRKIHSEVTLKLAELEALKPRGIYYTLRFQLEFNGFGDIRYRY